MFKTEFLVYLILMDILVATAISSIAFSHNVANNSDERIWSPAYAQAGSQKTGNITIIDAVGDLDCSGKLHDRIAADDPTIFIALGDLCYNRNLTNFTITFKDFKDTNKLECVIGNHDSKENGNLKILKQVLTLCGDHWLRKVANGSTLIIGLNTNGDTIMQSEWASSVVKNSTIMKEIKNVILVAHKPAHTPPGSDHDAETSTIKMFTSIIHNIAGDIRIFEIAGHNHLMGASNNGRWFISGAGSEKLYNFSIDPQWPFVNNKERGYLQFKINDTDGSILGTNFYSLEGKVLY
jgi:calcineurin-like phosphoesterase family protein